MGSGLTIFQFFLFFNGYGLDLGHFWHVDGHGERAYNLGYGLGRATFGTSTDMGSGLTIFQFFLFFRGYGLSRATFGTSTDMGSALTIFSFSVFQRLRPWPGRFWHVDGHGERAYNFSVFLFFKGYGLGRATFGTSTDMAGPLLARRRTWGAG